MDVYSKFRVLLVLIFFLRSISEEYRPTCDIWISQKNKSTRGISLAEALSRKTGWYLPYVRRNTPMLIAKIL